MVRSVKEFARGVNHPGWHSWPHSGDSRPPLRKHVSFRRRDIGQLGQRWPLLGGVGAVTVDRWVRQPDDSQLLERVRNRQPQKRRRIRRRERNGHSQQRVSRSGTRIIGRSHGGFRRRWEADKLWHLQRIRGRHIRARCDRLLRHDGTEGLGFGGECREIQHGSAPVGGESLVSQRRRHTGEGSKRQRPQVRPHLLGAERSRGRWLRGHGERWHRELLRRHETLGKELSICCRRNERDRGECQARWPSEKECHEFGLRE